MKISYDSLKGSLKKGGKKVSLLLGIGAISFFLLGAADYTVTVDNGIYKEGDMKNVNYGASQYINTLKIDSDGALKNDMTVQELWDTLVENNSPIINYLKTPQELARLMKAEIVTQYPDIRQNPDEEIKWEEIIENEDLLQGIIKFKRADENNNISTMTYVDSETFQSYIDEYNSSGSQSAKKNALTHFTLKKVSNPLSITGSDMVAAGEGIMTDVSQAIIDATDKNITPWPGKGKCAAWVSNVYVNAGLTVERGDAIDMARRNIISTDMTAIPIGAAVYGTGTGTYGHVGIYIGGGKVVDSLSTDIKIWNSLEEWIDWQYGEIDGKKGWLGWGWHDGHKTRGTTEDPNLTLNEESNEEILTKEIGAKKVDGDGYNEEYISSAGITYKHYKQFEGSYASNKYWGGTMQSLGCGPTSVAILASGLTNLDLTPADIAAQMNDNDVKDKTSYKTLNEKMNELGMTSEVIQSPSAEDIQENLRNGNVMLVSVNSDTIFTNNSHIMAIVDINTDGQVYICNPGSSYLYGWYDISEIMKGCKYIVVTNAGAAGIAKSTNTSSYVAVVATWTQTDKLIKTDDPEVQATYGIGKEEAVVSSQYRMKTTNINYQDMVRQYAVPFDLLWGLLVVGQEKKFVLELADLVYGSDIQITIYDSVTTNTDIEEWKYTQETKAIVDANITAYYGEIRQNGKIEDDIHEPYKSNDYNTVKKVITKTNVISPAVTRANVWTVDYKNEYAYTSMDEKQVGNSDSNSEGNTNEETEYVHDSNGTTFECEEITNLKNTLKNSVINIYNQTFGELMTLTGVSCNETYNVEYYNRYVNISDTITKTVKDQKYTPGVSNHIEKVDKTYDPNFVTIFNKSKHRVARSNIRSGAQWLFEILEANNSTKDMVDLIKYLLYKATDINYGVDEEDISFDKIFSMKQTTTYGQIEGNTVKEQVWNYLISAGFSEECAAAVMGNMEAESGVDPTKIQSGGAGPAAGICQWENYNTKTGRWKNLYDFATNRGKDWTDLQSQLDFLMKELSSTFETYTGRERHYYDTGEWCFWPTEMSSEEFKMLTDIDLATEIFCRVFERPSIPHMNNRINYAHSYYELYKE